MALRQQGPQFIGIDRGSMFEFRDQWAYRLGECDEFGIYQSLDCSFRLGLWSASIENLTYPFCQLARHFLSGRFDCIDKIDLDQSHTSRHTLLIPH
jgi:hypothetical protein